MQVGCGALTFRSALRPSKTGVIVKASTVLTQAEWLASQTSRNGHVDRSI
jgi:hypothetical protein